MILPPSSVPTRRQPLMRIGGIAGSVTMYQAMTQLGHAAGTDFRGPPSLLGARKGTWVRVLGAGLAGMTAAYELRKAGYSVRVLEYQNRLGGRNYTLRGGDTFTELGGTTQHVGFALGNYINPGPWRIPYHHQALLHYCKLFGVKLGLSGGRVFPFLKKKKQKDFCPIGLGRVAPVRIRTSKSSLVLSFKKEQPFTVC